MASILLITPDGSLADHISQLLAADGHQVTVATTGDHPVAVGVSIPIDLVIVDSLTPGLGQIRALLAVPFVFLAAGAGMLPGRLPIREGDQAVPKPVDAHDIRAAVKAVLASDAAPAELSFAGVTLDRAGQRLLSESGAVQLTPIEFRLMERLAQARGGIATTEELLRDVWNYPPGTGSSDVIRSHLKNLRSKLRQATGNPDLIETVPRRGYRLAAR